MTRRAWEVVRSMSLSFLRTLAAVVVVWAAAPAGSAVAADSLVITHEPVKQAIKGQPLTLKARVTSRTGVHAATLYYNLSKDAAPFRVAMKPVGLDFYLGTIDGALLAGVPSVSYYLEAEDAAGAVKETPWQVIQLREAKPGESNAPPPPGGTRLPAPGEDQGDGISLGLIAGGAVAVIGGALLIADSDSGGSDDDDGGGSPTDPGAAAGTYQGTATTCLTLSGQAPSCEEHPVTFIIDSQGTVLSDDLVADQALTDRLSGPNFTLVATVGSGTSTLTGQIFFNGSVVNNQIVGNISGSQSGGPLGPGSYSGSFSARKQ